jgi:hypothetical protein
MTGPRTGSSPEEARRRAERRRRLAEVFGDDLPEQTADDREDPAERPVEDADEWLRRQVPPHHGG